MLTWRTAVMRFITTATSSTVTNPGSPTSSSPPVDLDEIPDEEGLGVDASGVKTVIEVTSPGRRNLQRDRARKRREYARAGIPVYVIVDDFDDEGAVLVLTSPDPKKAKYADEHRVPYGADAVIPEGPAKGFAVGKAIVAS
jgi:hypothetical protein